MSTREAEEEGKVSEEAEQHIPVLEVDESLSVEERFTDNAIDNILPARYLVKDEDGEVVEEPHELFERVADNVATAEYQFAEEQGISDEEAHRRFEEWKGEFEELMKEQRFIFNSPTLMNAGQPLQQLSACISGDTPIYTEDGLKLMEDVSVGDNVLTHEGRFKEVTDLQSSIASVGGAMGSWPLRTLWYLCRWERTGQTDPGVARILSAKNVAQLKQLRFHAEESFRIDTDTLARRTEALKEADVEITNKPEITVQNIVASSELDATLNLNRIAFELVGTEYEPEQFPGLVYRLEEPEVVFLLFSSGNLVCTGGRTYEDVKEGIANLEEDLEEIGAMN